LVSSHIVSKEKLRPHKTRKLKVEASSFMIRVVGREYLTAVIRGRFFFWFLPFSVTFQSIFILEAKKHLCTSGYMVNVDVLSQNLTLSSFDEN